MTEPPIQEPPEPPRGDEPDPRPRRKSRILRWVAIGFGVLAGVLLLALGIVYARGRAALGGSYEITPPTVNVPTDAGTVARGEHIARTHGCLHCHGEQLQGRVLADVPPFFIAPPNLTRGAGGVGSAYAAVDWDRAVRYGARPDGTALLPVMPYEHYNRLNDADMAALSAYLSSLPAVDNEVPPTRAKFLGYLIFGMQGGVKRDDFDQPRPIIAPGPTAEYGAYFASTTCVACHGKRLEGQEGHQKTPGLHGYGTTEMSVLARVLREGVTPDGRQLDPDVMPWRAFQYMDDVEIQAVHAYLATLARRN